MSWGQHPISLGIKTATTDIAGAKISEIVLGSVADHAGLHVGDVINSIDGKAIRTPANLEAEFSNRMPGTTIRIGYMVRTSLGSFPKEATLALPLPVVAAGQSRVAPMSPVQKANSIPSKILPSVGQQEG